MSYIVIDESKCKSCYLCINACPKKLIKAKEKPNNFGEYTAEFKDDKKECIACAKCALVCPDIAITKVVKEWKNKYC